MTLGETISDLRKRKGISQELLAEISGVSLRTIQRIERDVTNPRPYTSKILAKALDVEVERLTTINSGQLELTQNEFNILRKINISASVVIILPIGNILFPLLIWSKNKELPMVYSIGKKIISYQILWTIITLLALFLTPIISYAITGSVAIGRFHTVSFVYIILVAINILLILRTTIRLNKNNPHIYSFIPNLF